MSSKHQGSSKPINGVQESVKLKKGWLRFVYFAALIAIGFGIAFATTSLLNRVQKASPKSYSGMIWIPPGEFLMGTSEDTPNKNEQPAHLVKIKGFWIDEHEVTNEQFQKFVEATGYITTAEKAPDWDELKKQLPPGTLKPAAEKLVAGSLVFSPPIHSVPTDDPRRMLETPRRPRQQPKQ
jgi:formylglycine-generating enzyme required for sulfatase activity